MTISNTPYSLYKNEGQWLGQKWSWARPGEVEDGRNGYHWFKFMAKRAARRATRGEVGGY